MITAQNGKGSRSRKVNGDKYRACKLWDKKVVTRTPRKGGKRELIARILDELEEAAQWKQN